MYVNYGCNGAKGKMPFFVDRKYGKKHNLIFARSIESIFTTLAFSKLDRFGTANFLQSHFDK